jgi:hypothetical protein
MQFGNTYYHSLQNLSSSHLLSKILEIKLYRTVILPVVLYGYETWSHTLREENRLGVFENRVLRIFGPKREVAGGLRRLPNGNPYNLYTSPNEIKEDEMGGYIANVAEMRNGCKILARKPKGMRSLRRPRCRWEDNIIMGLREIWWESVERTHLTQDSNQ